MAECRADVGFSARPRGICETCGLRRAAAVASAEPRARRNARVARIHAAMASAARRPSSWLLALCVCWCSAVHDQQLPAQLFDALTKHPLWDNAAIRHEFSAALGRIADAPIRHEPFPHIVVEPLFSPRFYRELMRELPPSTEYRRQPYAGTMPTYS